MALVRKKKRHMLEMGLNITSLIDVLTVILFFLVKSMSVTTAAVKPPPDIRLPAAVSNSKVVEATSVALSLRDLRVNGQVILTLKNGKFAAAQLSRDGQEIKVLQTALTKERQKKLALFKGVSGKKFLAPRKILIQADKDLPFDTIKYVLHTAAVAGYTDYQFVVIQRSARAPASTP